MDTAGPDGLGQAIVGIILMVREDLSATGGSGSAGPAARRCASAATGRDDTLPASDAARTRWSPADPAPTAPAARRWSHRSSETAWKNPLRLDAPEQHCLAAGDQAAEPMHLCAGMVQRRDAAGRHRPGSGDGDAARFMQELTSALCRCRIALGKPVVPEEK